MKGVITAGSALLLLACGASAPPASPGAGRTALAQDTREPESTLAPTSEAAGVTPAPREDVVDADLAIVLGGMLSDDHLGPEAAAALRARLDEAPRAYLERFSRVQLRVVEGSVVPPPPDARTDRLLALLYPHAPEATRQLAQRLASIDREALRDGRISDERGRVARRLRALTLLGAGVDLPFGPTWVAVQPDHACVDDALLGEPVIRVGVDCTCGEPLACAARLEEGVVRVDVSHDPSAPSACLDCFQTWTSCRIPEAARRRATPVEVNGEPRGTSTGPRCAPAPGT